MSRIHLAIFHSWALKKILSGEKTIESRFNKVCIPPFEQCASGDTILLKKAGGKIVGVATVKKCLFMKDSTVAEARSLVKKYQKNLGFSSEDKWFHGKTKYISLIWLKNIRPCAPYVIPKKDRSAWKILK